MIARIWFGRTRAEHFDEYARYVEGTGIRDLSATAGNLGAFLVRRMVHDEAEFGVISFWESLDAIRSFAGDEIDVARYYPDDSRFLLELAPKVEHYEICAAKGIAELADRIGGTVRGDEKS